MINTAGMPRICVRKDSATLKWRKKEIDLPNPQPGQNSMPRLWNGQNEKVLPSAGSIYARNSMAESQMIISRWYVMNDLMNDALL
jgi:hypothetical protein